MIMSVDLPLQNSDSDFTAFNSRGPVSRDFIEAGRAVFTVQVSPEFYQSHDCKPHYTFRVTEKDCGGPYPLLFVSMLSGPYNASDFNAYFGILDRKNGQLRLTAKSAKGIDGSWPFKILNRVLIRIWAGEQNAIESAGFRVFHEGRCGRCGRPLTTPESVRSGFGPECLRLMRVGK